MTDEDSETVWTPIATYPKEECAVTFRLKNGQLEDGQFAIVMRKDGLQMAPIGANGWLAMWRFGDDRVAEWTKREWPKSSEV